MTVAISDNIYVPRVKDWFESEDEVYSFARDMVSAGRFDYADEIRDAVERLLRFFEKPWHWDTQHAWWVANNRPDGWEMWEKGEEMEWEGVVGECCECGEPITPKESFTVNVEKANRLYPGYAGDDVCEQCFVDGGGKVEG